MSTVTFEPLNPLLGPVELTRQLCNIESVSGNEREIADAIEQLLKDQAPHLKIFRDADTVIARTELGRKQRVILAGHIDTVPLNENLPVEDRTDPETGQAMLWGRGTVDMKAGAAVHLLLALELNEPAVDLTWVWYDHEEVSAELNGLGRAIRNQPELFNGDFAILGEPSNGTIEGGCNGTLSAVVTFTGKRAHSARSWRGVNAIQRSAGALAQLANYTAETVQVDGLEYYEGLNAVGIQGGVAGNVIPDSCTIDVNYRFAPDKTAREAVTFIEQFFAEADHIKIADIAVGARPGLTSPLARDLVAAIGEPPVAKLGWTDVARFSELGIPAVNFGPGDPSLSHADDERVCVIQIEETYNSLRTWLQKPQS